MLSVLLRIQSTNARQFRQHLTLAHSFTLSFMHSYLLQRGKLIPLLVVADYVLHLQMSSGCYWLLFRALNPNCNTDPREK